MPCSGRLQFREFRRDDAPLLLALRTDLTVRRFLGGPVDAPLLGDVIARSIGQPGVFRVSLAETDEGIGCVALHEGHGEHELSYDFLPPAWGHGYATEAALAVLGWVWATTNVDSVIAVTRSANERSRRLLDRLGFAHEAEFEEWGAQQCRYRIGRS